MIDITYYVSMDFQVHFILFSCNVVQVGLIGIIVKCKEVHAILCIIWIKPTPSITATLKGTKWRWDVKIFNSGGTLNTWIYCSICQTSCLVAYAFQMPALKYINKISYILNWTPTKSPLTNQFMNCLNTSKQVSMEHLLSKGHIHSLRWWEGLGPAGWCMAGYSPLWMAPGLFSYGKFVP